MRTSLAILTLILAFSAAAQDALLERGLSHYRAGRYAEAVNELNAAAQGYLSNDHLQEYVSTGKFANLQKLETAFVYLALANSRLGNETAAREAIQRLMTAERIEPTYARLSLATDAAEFEALAARLVPDANLGRGASVQIATAPQPQSQRVAVVEKMVEEDCARIEREAEERIAAIRREADERVAAAERAAAARISEIERAAAQRIATAEAAQREAERRAAAVPLPVPVPMPRPVEPQPVIVETRPAGEWSDALRRADEFVAAGRFAEANEIYARVSASNAPRDLRVRAAVALYRTGAFRQAAPAFDRLAPFARGEEDLRYYFAVSLYETGSYTEARHELSCALPFIRQTEDVIRYRTKIEQMLAWQNAQPREVAQR